MAATQQAAPKTPKQPKEQVQKQVAQEQPQIPQEQPQVPQEQLQAAQNQEQQAQEQPQEQPQVPQEQLQAAQNQEQQVQEQPQEQQQTNDQLKVTQEQPQLTQEQIEAANQFIEADKKTKESISDTDRLKLVLNAIKEIKSKWQAEPTPVRIGIKDFHDKMMAESEQRAADALKAKEESEDSNVVTRRK